MLSICIPVYQYDVVSLVEDLKQQAKALDVTVEIILIDDASSEDYRKINSAIEGVKYVQLEHNIGRAVIRNRFLKYAKYNHLLFLDTDSIVYRDHFLKDYVQLIKEGKDVICGGRVYPDTIDDNNRSLSWKYGMQRESKPAEK